MSHVPPLPHANYEFSGETVDSTIFRLRSFHCTEHLSAPYAIEVELYCDEFDYPWQNLLGTKCTLQITRDSFTRNFHGIADRVELLDVIRDRCGVRLRLVPALALLQHVVDSRIFQNQSVPEILQAVLTKPLGTYQRKLKLDLRATYLPRVLCVQYQESGLAFVHRLMEEAGIGYYFDHRDPLVETMVLFDQTNKLPAIQTFQGGHELSWISTNPGDVSEESVQSFEPARELRLTRVVQLDFDYRVPDTPIRGQAPGTDSRGKEREVYLHDHRRFDQNDQGNRSIFVRDAASWLSHQGHATSNASGLSPGHQFELVDLDGLLSGKYLLTSVTHHGESPESSGLGAGSATQPRYTNELKFIAADVSYRPALRTPRPKIDGPQTAIVVGPSGEELYTDELGRIKIFLHWDRYGARDQEASPWVRVAQTWAGGGFGAFVLPRIGMEVVVEFIDGNPDCPIVTGCVYNGKLSVPYELPGNATRSTFKTRSLPGGDGFNELRFEDSKGHEEVFIHAEKDQNIVVKNNETRDVGVDDSLKVGRDRKTEIGRDHSVKVGQNERIGVGNNRDISVGQNQSRDVGANDSLMVGKNRDVTVTLASTETVGLISTETVGASKIVSVVLSSTETVGRNKSVSVGANYSEDVQGQMQTTIGKAMKLEVGDNAAITVAKNLSASVDKKASFVVTDEITIKCGKATVTIKKSGDVAIETKKLDIKASGDITMKGSKIKLN